MKKKFHPPALWLLKFLLLTLGISALVPGLELLLDPSGKRLQFPEGALEASPFADYFAPGLLLTLFIGLLPLSAFFALWKKPNCALCQRLNPIPGRHWAWTLALASGIGLMLWIAVQVTIVPYFFLQPLFFGWGAAIVLLCWLPGVRAHYSLPQSQSNA